MGFDEGRINDLKDLDRKLAATTDRVQRSRLIDSVQRIAQESPVTREMRRRLIQATKAGDTKEVNRISERVAKERRLGE